MDLQLIPRSLEQSNHQFGRPQLSGPMTMLPLFREDIQGEFHAPFSGLKLGGVHGYGNIELTNPAETGLTIVPSHIGYIQDQAQNHALCSAVLLGAGQTRKIEDACCVQQAQGGYLEEKEQWFFILPVALREQALRLRGQQNFGKLWPAISSLCSRFGTSNVGHLEQIISRQRATLTQYQSRFELLSGQTGALFFLRDQLIGVEIGPTASYFREIWMPLICFCYGTAILEIEQHRTEHVENVKPFDAKSLTELRLQLKESRKQRLSRLEDSLARLPESNFVREEQERFLNYRLNNVESKQFIGQTVEEGNQLVYTSITAKESYLQTALTCEPSEN